MRISPLVMAALLAACATAEPEPEAPSSEEVLGPTERYGPLIEQEASARLAQEPADAVPSGIEVTVLSVEETAAGLFYNAELSTPSRRRRDEDYVIYGQCAAADIAACANQIVSGARMLAKP